MAPETCVNAFDALAEPTVPVWASARQTAARSLPVVMAASACGLLGWYLTSRGEAWPQLRLASPAMLVVCGLATLGAMLAPGPIFWVMTRRVGKQIGLAESTWLSVLTVAISAVVPFHGGAAARAMYLKRRHGLELSAFAATFLGYNILRLLAASLVALSAGGWLLWRQPQSGAALIAIVTVAAGFASAAVAACLVRPSWFGALAGHWLLAPLARFQQGWQELMACPRFLGRVLALVGLQIACELVAVWAAWSAVGLPLSAAVVLLVTGFAILTALTGLTPNGLGLVELVTVLVGASVAIDPAHGIAAGLVGRGVLMVVVFLTAPIALAAIWRLHGGRQAA
jgi:uncharacterized membrane protein YbhN (UPF0104 family)